MIIPPNTEFLTVPDLVDLLGEPVGRVRRLIEDHYLGAVYVDGVLKVPASFIQDGAPIPALRGTLILLEDSGFSNEEAVAWMLNENAELGMTPIQALAEGRKSTVRRATQSLAF